MNRNKKICFVTNSLAMGGTEHHLAQILPALKRRGWDVQLYLLSKELSLSPLLQESKVPFFTPPWYISSRCSSKIVKKIILLMNSATSFIWLVQQFVKKPFDIYHFFLPQAYIVGMLACIVLQIKAPIIMSRRSLNNYQKKHKLLAWIECQLHKRCTKILGNSKKIIKQLQEEENVPIQKLELIYNGVSLSKEISVFEKKELLHRFGIKDSENPLLFLMVANLYPYKNHYLLLETLFSIRKQLPPTWYLLCVGEDKGTLSSLQQLSKELNFEKNIKWLGIQGGVKSIWQLADIGILCSNEEGFANVIVEGMAAARCMIVTDVGGNKEAVENGKTGIVVPANDKILLGAAIIELAADNEKRIKMGQAGRARVEKFFTFENCINQYELFYSQLLH